MSKAQILIVEDDAITKMDIENQLKSLDYGVTAKVARVEDAIKQVKENTPDLVLMDIVLKGEMDGIEAADEIRSQFDIPVVFLTAYADRKRLERAKLTTPFGFIIKPFQDKDLSVTIEMALYIAKVDAERKQAEEMLQKAHDELEKRVKQRTAELLRVNDQLKIEIVDRKRAEKRINVSLNEKEVLLSEIHHRVKNNFEIVSSLLDMSSMHTENFETQKLLEDARSRIHSMALIHGQLYQSDRFDQIKMERHVQELVDHLSHVYADSGKEINSLIEPSDVYLSVDQAVPCALVLNELIANAFKHAFRESEQGTVHVSIKNSTDNNVVIKIKDDGKGIPEWVDVNVTRGLGLKLVRHLVTGQLKGEMHFNHDDGTEVCIDFKRIN